MRFSESFEVFGNIETMSPAIRSYYELEGRYKTKMSSPHLLVFERGSKLGVLVSPRIKHYPTRLEVSLNSQGKRVQVLCTYDVSTLPGNVLTKGDISALKSEVERLRRYITLFFASWNSS